MLLLARWMEGTARYDTQTVLRQYKVFCNTLCFVFIYYIVKDVLTHQPEFEDGHFYLAKYYDRLMAFLAGDRPSKLGYIVNY